MAVQLRYLCLQTNGLASLSNTSLTGMPQLEQFLVGDQPSLAFPMDVFNPVPNLLQLRMYKLGLTLLPPIAHLTQLQLLSVNGNPIRTLDTRALTSVPLYELDLSETPLTVLNASMLAPFPNLAVLHLAQVSLRDCPETTFDVVPQLRVLSWFGSLSDPIEVVLTARHLYSLTQLRTLGIDNHANWRDTIEQWGKAFAQRYAMSALYCHGLDICAVSKPAPNDLSLTPIFTRIVTRALVVLVCP